MSWDAWLVGGYKILQYANDTLICAKVDKANIPVSKVLLYSFELFLGLSINFQESAVVPIGEDSSQPRLTGLTVVWPIYVPLILASR